MFLKLGPASLSLSSVKFGKGGYAVFRNEHFHFGVAVQELPFLFCRLSFQRSLSLFGKTSSRDTFPTPSIVS